MIHRYIQNSKVKLPVVQNRDRPEVFMDSITEHTDVEWHRQLPNQFRDLKFAVKYNDYSS